MTKKEIYLLAAEKIYESECCGCIILSDITCTPLSRTPVCNIVRKFPEYFLFAPNSWVTAWMCYRQNKSFFFKKEDNLYNGLLMSREELSKIRSWMFLFAAEMCQ